MARERMVTRTVSFTECNVMVMHVSTATVTTETLRISGTFDNDNDILKAVKKSYETVNDKPTYIVSSEVKEILYGMSEEDFIRRAKELPPRKVYDNTTEA